MGATGCRNASNRHPPITGLLASHVLNACDTPIHPSLPVGWFSVGQRHRRTMAIQTTAAAGRADNHRSMSTEADPKTRLKVFGVGYLDRDTESTRLQIFQGFTTGAMRYAGFNSRHSGASLHL